MISFFPLNFLSRVNDFVNMLRNRIFHAGSKRGISPFSKPKPKNKCLKLKKKVSYKPQFLMAPQRPTALNDEESLAYSLTTVLSS